MVLSSDTAACFGERAGSGAKDGTVLEFLIEGEPSDRTCSRLSLGVEPCSVDLACECLIGFVDGVGIDDRASVIFDLGLRKVSSTRCV